MSGLAGLTYAYDCCNSSFTDFNSIPTLDLEDIHWMDASQLGSLVEYLFLSNNETLTRQMIEALVQKFPVISKAQRATVISKLISDKLEHILVSYGPFVVRLFENCFDLNYHFKTSTWVDLKMKLISNLDIPFLCNVLPGILDFTPPYRVASPENVQAIFK
jgi:hypothetical protein